MKYAPFGRRTVEFKSHQNLSSYIVISSEKEFLKYIEWYKHACELYWYETTDGNTWTNKIYSSKELARLYKLTHL
jgi:hypothetical protein